MKRRVVPELDTSFAKDLGEFDNARCVLQARVREPRARSQARCGARDRAELMKQLATAALRRAGLDGRALGLSRLEELRAV